MDYDGIVAAYPAIKFSKFILADIYPRIVVQRDVDGKYMSAAQLDFVSNTAIAACDMVGGKHLGFIINPEICHYDPTKDARVLCAESGGENETPACVTKEQALAINKMWYGMTSDGSVPDPAVDNGSGPLTGKHKGYGNPRGTSLTVLGTDTDGQSIDRQLLAVTLQDPTIAPLSFRNAMSNGKDGWKSLSYGQLSGAIDMTETMEAELDYVDADNPDLSAFKKRGGKLIHFHGTIDALIPHLISVNYYESVIARMNGLKGVQDFYRFYLIHGMNHGPANGMSNPDANPPVTRVEKAEAYRWLTNWVEKGTPPENIVLQSANDRPVAKSLPLCAYPARASYVAGDINAAASYACQ